MSTPKHLPSIAHQYLHSSSTKSLLTYYTARTLLGTSVVYCLWRGAEYWSARRQWVHGFQKMHAEYVACRDVIEEQLQIEQLQQDDSLLDSVTSAADASHNSSSSLSSPSTSQWATLQDDITSPATSTPSNYQCHSVTIRDPYNTPLQFAINEASGELHVLVPHHKAWFSEFGLPREELHQMKQLLLDGKVVFHRTPYTLYTCIGDAALAPGVNLSDNAFENNYGPSILNSKSQQRFDLIMHATPDAAALWSEKNSIRVRKCVTYMVAGVAGSLFIGTAWKGTLRKHSDVLAKFLRGEESKETSSVWNKFTWKVAAFGALCGASVRFAMDVYPTVKYIYECDKGLSKMSSSQLPSGLSSGTPLSTFATYKYQMMLSGAHAVGIFLQMTVLLYLVTRYLGVRVVGKEMQKRAAMLPEQL